MKRLITASAALAAITALAACSNESIIERFGIAVDNATYGLGGAIAAAGVPDGAIVMEAEIELEGDEAIYEVEYHFDGMKTEVEIDSATGVVLETETEPSDGEDTFADVTVSLSAAIATAEAEVGGAAVEAELEAGDLLYEVEVLVDGAVFEVELSAQTGEVLDVEEDDDFEDEESDEDDDEDSDDGDSDSDADDGDDA